MTSQKDPLEESIRYHLDDFELPVSSQVWEQIKQQAIHASVQSPVQAHTFFRYTSKWIIAAGFAAILGSSLLYFSLRSSPKPEHVASFPFIAYTEPNFGGCPALPGAESLQIKTGTPETLNSRAQSVYNTQPDPESSLSKNGPYCNAVSADFKGSLRNYTVGAEEQASPLPPALTTQHKSELSDLPAPINQKEQNLSEASLPPTGSVTSAQLPERSITVVPMGLSKRSGITSDFRTELPMLLPEFIQADSLVVPLQMTVKKSDSASTEFVKGPHGAYFQTRFADYALLVEAGPSISYRNLEGADQRMIRLRNQNESMLLTGNLFIGGELTIRNNWMISAGLGIFSKGESNQIPSHPSKTDTIYQGTYDINCGCYYIKADISHISANTALTTQNRYLFLNLPVSLAYHFKFRHNWFLNPGMGIGINYILAATSSWVDPRADTVITYNKSGKGYTSFSVSARGTVELGKTIGERLSLGFKPGYTLFLQSIFLNGYSQYQYPYSFDLSFSLHYKF